MNKSKVELADFFREHIGNYRKQYRMSKEQFEVVYDIVSCRTAYLGGHVEKCDHCGLERPAYTSCRNRHCPKCKKGTMKKRFDLPKRFGQNPFYLIHPEEFKDTG